MINLCENLSEAVNVGSNVWQKEYADLFRACPCGDVAVGAVPSFYREPLKRAGAKKSRNKSDDNAEKGINGNVFVRCGED